MGCVYLPIKKKTPQPVVYACDEYLTFQLILLCLLSLMYTIFMFCSNPNMKFRNYLPHDKQLQEGKLAPPVLPKFEDPAAVAPPPLEKKEVCGFLYHLIYVLR